MTAFVCVWATHRELGGSWLLQGSDAVMSSTY